MNRVANLSKLMDEVILDHKIKLEKEQEHMTRRGKTLRDTIWGEEHRERINELHNKSKNQ